jgi:hypothetical protein
VKLLLGAVCAAALVVPAPAGAVVGGDEADEGEWPWQVALQVDGDTVCGGALLALDAVVTAAHCVDGIDDDDLSVLAGSVEEDEGDERSPASVVVHDGYDRSTTQHDIAVLVLESPYEASATIRPVTVPDRSTSAAMTAGGEVATVTGFGATTEDGVVSPVLREAEVPVIADTVCTARYADDGDEVFGATQVCAGHDRGHVDACFGDSGGPLVLPVEDEGSWVLVGLVSWGAGCGRALRPTVYTEVAAYAGWLAEVGVVGADGTRFVPERAGALQLPARGATRGKAGDYPWTVAVRELDARTVSSVSVELHGLSHERPSDLDIWLEAPDGTVVTLLSDVGGDEPVAGVDVVIEAGAPDAGRRGLGLQVAPTDLEVDSQRKGAVAPASLDPLAGVRARGRWRLLVADDTTGATGTLESWTLVLR